MLDFLQDHTLPRVELKGLGAKMPRTRFQRPKVKRRGARGREYYIAEFHVYTVVDGVERRRHKVEPFGLCSTTTRQEAQEKCDRFMAGINGQSAKPDGSITVEQFWEQIYWPSRAARWALNTRAGMESTWRLRIKPAIGSMPLESVLKHHLERCLLDAAGAGAGRVLLKRMTFLVKSLFDEALDNEYLDRSPARKLRPPASAPTIKPRSLSEVEVVRLLSATTGTERLMWGVMLLTGLRLGELLALRRDDLRGATLRVDESALEGKPGPVKNRKTRTVPLPDTLREDLAEHAAALPEHQPLLFPGYDGRMRLRNSVSTREILARGRKAAGIPDLTWRMCRTTFATLYEGDIADAQAILGHATPQFTASVYRRSQTERAQKAVEGLAARVVPIRKGA